MNVAIYVQRLQNSNLVQFKDASIPLSFGSEQDTIIYTDYV